MKITDIKEAPEAVLLLERALRLEDRGTAEAVLSYAQKKGWLEVPPVAVTYLEHHINCPAARIEITDHSNFTRPGDPGHGITTVHCIDCGAHRGHDGTGLPAALPRKES